jgi:hypothetical protein
MGEDIKGIVQYDGSLYSPSKYIYWKIGDEEATLDGSFSLEYLEFIVKRMKSFRKKNNTDNLKIGSIPVLLDDTVPKDEIWLKSSVKK